MICRLELLLFLQCLVADVIMQNPTKKNYNRTSIDESAFPRTVVIIAQEGSFAHEYAIKHDFTFKVIEGA